MSRRAAFRLQQAALPAGFFLLAASLLLPCAVGAAGPAAAPARPSAPPAAAHADSSRTEGAETIIETTIAGLTLRPAGSRSIRTLSDYDIVFEGDRRLVPLLRTLRLLGLEPSREDSGYVFQTLPSGPATVDPARSLVVFDGRRRAIESRFGISDVTSRDELWIPEQTMAELLGGTVQWNDSLYASTFVVAADLDWRQEGRSASGGADDQEFVDSEAAMPPRPRALAPSLQFMRLDARSDLLRSTISKNLVARTELPEIGLWGEGAGGAFTAQFAPRSAAGASGLALRRASWTTAVGEVQASLGDARFGISELAFPSLSLVGARINGMVGGEVGERDPSRLGLLDEYSPARTFQGTAPLGSEVTLSLNGREVEVAPVDPSPEAGPGEGVWRFDASDLLLNRVNELLVRIRRPDGRTEEIRQDVVGSSRMAPGGGAAFLLAGGRRRSPDGESLIGRFAGGRLLLGLSRGLTVGLFGGTQEGWFRRVTASDTLLYGTPPERSVQGGSRVAMSIGGHLLADAEVAMSHIPATRSPADPGPGESALSGNAWNAEAEWYSGPFVIGPRLFRYSSDFHDGGDHPLRDRSGGEMRIDWRAGPHRIELAGVRVRDNVDGRLATTEAITAVHADWTALGLAPRTQTSLQFDHLRSGSDEIARSFGFGATSGFLPRWRARAGVAFNRNGPPAGEDVTRRRRDLLLGLPARLPSQGSTEVSALLERDLGPAWSAGVEHRGAAAWRQSWLEITRRETATGALQLRAAAGYDWIGRHPLYDLRSALFLDPIGQSRIVLEGQRGNLGWSVRAGVQLDLLVGFDGTVPRRIAEIGMDPEQGGVVGRVFVDANGNGVRDRGEGGLPDVGVAGDMGRRTLTSKRGFFVLPTSADQRRVTVGLQAKTLSALYTPTTPARRQLLLSPGLFTEVEFGVAMLGEISGRVYAASPDSAASNKGIAGVRVEAVDAQGKVARSSITAKDGSYDLGELLPGRYQVRVAPESIPRGLRLQDSEIAVEVRTLTEPGEETSIDFGARPATPSR